jgi:predicted amidohydrolase
MDWQDPAASRDRYERHLEGLQGVDLVVLPEMFSTGFYMEPWHCYETMEGDTVAWMQRNAAESGAVITGSLVMRVGDEYRNRMIWARPDGGIDWYDKRHLFRYGGEHHHFTGGQDRVVMDLNGWRVALFVCYDLRFPVFCRNLGDYDLALYVANWPDARQYAWDTLVRARAIENQAYVIGCNRLGSDPKGNTFSGGSVILDFLGKPMVDCGNRTTMAVESLSMPDLLAFREHFPAAMDADGFRLTNPGSD